LHNGDVVAMPTETVYGLAGVAGDDDAVLRIYETKGRPRFNPLIVHCADLAMAENIAQFNPLARKIADVLWPGPLTLVLPKRPTAELSDLVTAGLDTVAIRMPRHPIAREIIAKLGQPVAAPSANPSGRLSPTMAQHVIDGFDGQVAVVDGGPCDEGVESTILAIGEDALTLLRPGTITAQEIHALTGLEVKRPESDKVVAPGMLKSHYAPNAQVVLNADMPIEGQGYLAFGADQHNAQQMINLSPAGDLREAAKNLFHAMRELDQMGVDTIAVAPIPNVGLGVAINDRLSRAAADRNS
jgi:L-threonylcarbamoyladenylate synthase